MKMIRHLSINIDFLLRLPDKKLSKFFGMSADDARKDLEAKKALGHIKIGSENCEGFDPFDGGCPGHPQKAKTKKSVKI